MLRQNALTLYNTTGLVLSYQALLSAPIHFIVSRHSLRFPSPCGSFHKLPIAALQLLIAVYRLSIATFSYLCIMHLGSSYYTGTRY